MKRRPPSSISKRGRTLKVAGLAARVGASYGRSLISRTLGLTDQDSASLVHSKNAARILETAVALRGPFMKVVQMIATQGDLVPEEYFDSLSTVHDKAPPLPWEEVRPVLAAEFGRDPEQVFRTINPEPIAAASLGQVYSGVLPDGTPVAIKVQYPGVADAVDQDLKVIRRLLKTEDLVGSALYRLPSLGFGALFEDLAGRMREELDYYREAANIEAFRRIYRGWDYVRVPRVYREFSTGKVLTMDLMDGVPMGTMLRGEMSDTERERLEIRMYEMFFHETHGVGVFHADPHPGNRLVGSDGSIALLDFGCVKVVPLNLLENWRKTIGALLAGDDQTLLECLRQVGLYRDGLNPEPILKWMRFCNYPLLVDEPFDPDKVDYGGDIIRLFTELATHGYATFPEDQVFGLRVFLGLTGIFRTIRARTINFHQLTIKLLGEMVPLGRNLREKFDAEGILKDGRVAVRSP